MDMDFFQKFLIEEQRLFEELNEIDEHQKDRGEFYCRYISKSFADRKAYYQIVDETPRKYILNWVVGEDPYPEWGMQVKLPKKKVQEMIKGRDYFDEIIKKRKQSNA